MNRSEIAKMLVAAKLGDDRISIDRGRVSMWDMALDNDIPFEFAVKAVADHYANSQITVLPVHINDRWRTEKREIADRERNAAMMQAQRDAEINAVRDPSEYIAIIRRTIEESKTKANRADE